MQEVRYNVTPITRKSIRDRWTKEEVIEFMTPFLPSKDIETIEDLETELDLIYSSPIEELEGIEFGTGKVLSLPK